MRVLITTTPGRGHYHPMLPLAHALAARGHDLLWAAHDEVCQRLRAQGFDARATGLAEGATDVNLAERYPELLTMPESERLGFAVSKIFGTPAAAPMLEDAPGRPGMEAGSPDL